MRRHNNLDHLVGEDERQSEEAGLLRLDYLLARRSTLKELKRDVSEIEVEIAALKAQLK